MSSRPYTARAPLPIATTPAASPSRPSIRFTALVRAITQTAMMSGVIVSPGLSDTMPASGTLNCHSVSPRK